MNGYTPVKTSSRNRNSSNLSKLRSKISSVTATADTQSQDMPVLIHQTRLTDGRSGNAWTGTHMRRTGSMGRGVLHTGVLVLMLEHPAAQQCILTSTLSCKYPLLSTCDFAARATARSSSSRYSFAAIHTTAYTPCRCQFCLPVKAPAPILLTGSALYTVLF